jgi:hypothetical protein
MKAHLWQSLFVSRLVLLLALLVHLGGMLALRLLLGSLGDTGAIRGELTRISQELHIVANLIMFVKLSSKIRDSNI